MFGRMALWIFLTFPSSEEGKAPETSAEQSRQQSWSIAHQKHIRKEEDHLRIIRSLRNLELTDE